MEELNEVADLFDKYYKSYEETEGMNPEENAINKAESMLEQLGYSEKLRGGTYRNVYGSENRVVKIAPSTKKVWGSNQTAQNENKSEIRNNTRISNATIEDVVGEGTCSGDKYIADILDYEVGGNRWLIMERVEVTDDNVSNEIADRIQEALASASPRGIHISEISPINMGVKDGVPVIFDYAGS